MNKTPFYLVTGFLGSGKTTFLHNILEQYSRSRKIAIIQNEFADASIDGQQLQETGWNFNLVELNKGSVFCVCLFSGFRQALIDLVEEQSPDLIILEVTGVADPIAIAQLLEDKEVSKRIFLAHIWAIIDASNFFKIGCKLQCVMHQIEVADTVFINKKDLIDKETCKKTVNFISVINPFAEVILTDHCKVDTTSIFNSDITPHTLVEKNKIKGQLTQCGDGGFKTLVFKTTKIIKEKSMQEFFNSLDENTYRIKGFIKIEGDVQKMVQYTPQQLQIYPSDNRHITELIAIGKNTIDFHKLEV